MNIMMRATDQNTVTELHRIPHRWNNLPQPGLGGAMHALSNWPGALIEFSPDGDVVAANDLGTHLVRASAAIPGSPLQGLVALARQAEGSVCDRIEINLDGATRWFECTALPSERGKVIVLVRDQTYDINIRQALFDSRQRYRDLVTISSDFAFETDLTGKFVFVSPHGALGYSPEDLIGRHPREFLVDADIDDSDLPFHARAAMVHTQIWLRNVEGEETCLLASAVPVVDQDGRWRGARGLCRDVTHERLRDSELAQAKVREQVVAYVVNQIREEARPRAMLESAASMLGRATSAASAVLSYSEDEGWQLAASYGDWPEDADVSALAENLAKIQQTSEDNAGGYRMLGRITWYHGVINGAVLLLRKQSQRVWNDDERAMLEAVAGQLAIGMRQIADQRELERLSTTDALTGLMNRRAFQDNLEAALDRADRTEADGVLLFVDLDNFKQINDRNGHDVGDTVLREVSRLIQERNRKYDLVARLGGDEFAVWLDAVPIEPAVERAGQIIDAIGDLSRSYANPESPLGASIGLALFESGSGETLRELLMRGDEAMYGAKRAGKNSWVVAAPSQTAIVAPVSARSARRETKSVDSRDEDQIHVQRTD